MGVFQEECLIHVLDIRAGAAWRDAECRRVWTRLGMVPFDFRRGGMNFRPASRYYQPQWLDVQIGTRPCFGAFTPTQALETYWTRNGLKPFG